MNVGDEHELNRGDINETHIWGPPGCGKTTYVSRQVGKAAEKYGGDALLVCSFTKAAAAELAMRNLPVQKDRVGTLRSICFRALLNPEIADTRFKDWLLLAGEHRSKVLPIRLPQDSKGLPPDPFGDSPVRGAPA